MSSEMSSVTEPGSPSIKYNDIIGGVRDPRTGRIVPVCWVKVLRDDEMGYTLHEAHTMDGATVAVATDADPGRETRCWELIKPGYSEIAVPCTGGGFIHTWRDRGGVFEGHTVHQVLPGEQPHIRIDQNMPFLLKAGELGMAAFSFCQGLPFGEVSEMEKVVDAPAYE